LHFRFTGMVTEYNGRNYILLETSSQPTSLEEALSAKNLKPLARATTGPSQPKLTPAADLLDEMLKSSGTGPKRLEAPSGAREQADATTGGASVAPGAEPMNVLREGTFLIDRTGRLTRDPDGQQCEFTFDADGRALRDPPVIILPNLKLMAMETAVSAANRDLRFRVTGMVTEYRGRNCVLLEKVVVVPDVVQQF
jgi:hypothetical protein